MNISSSKIKILLILLLLLLSIPAVLPLFSSGFFPIHDDTQVARVSEMKNALSDGMFPVRWVANLGYGYGYPIFNFYAPLAYYIGGFINIVGFDSLIATKIMIGTGMILAGVSMYLFAREFWGKVGGFISAMLYLYAPYHAVNLYVRGAIAELWAYGILPLLFLSLYKIFSHLPDGKELQEKALKGKSQKSKALLTRKSPLWLWVCSSAISYAAIILSHNLTAMIITPFVILFAGILFILSIKRRYKKIYMLPMGLLLGVMLSAFYWLPVGYEMKYTNVLSVVGGGSDYPDHFVCLSQLWNSPWGYAGSAPGCMDGVSFKLGKLHIALAVISLISLFFYRKNKRVATALIMSVCGLGISLFFTLSYSQIIWDLIPQMAFLQFPWRFLLLVSFFISLLGGAFILLLPRLLKIVAGVGLVVAILLVNREIFAPSEANSRSAQDYTNTSEVAWTTSKISDEYMPQGFQKPKKKSAVPDRKVVTDPRSAKVIKEQAKTQQVEAVLEATKKTNVKLNIAYFPAWQVFIDGKKVEYKNTSTGLQVSIPQGRHTLLAVYTQTPVEQIGNIVSLTGVIVVIAGIITQRKDYKKIAKGS